MPMGHCVEMSVGNLYTSLELRREIQRYRFENHQYVLDII